MALPAGLPLLNGLLPGVLGGPVQDVDDWAGDMPEGAAVLGLFEQMLMADMGNMGWGPAGDGGGDLPGVAGPHQADSAMGSALSTLAPSLTQLTQLTRLELDGVISHTTLMSLTSPSLTGLRSLIIHKHCAAASLTHVSTLTQLTQLRLSCSPVSPELLSALGALTGLESLGAVGSFVTAGLLQQAWVSQLTELHVEDMLSQTSGQMMQVGQAGAHNIT